MDFEYYMRNDAAKRLREGSEGKEVRFDAEFGSEEGPQGRRGLPPHQEQDARHQRRFRDRHLSQSSDILGVALEDAVEIILE